MKLTFWRLEIYNKQTNKVWRCDAGHVLQETDSGSE